MGTTCPMYYNVKGRPKANRTSEIFDAKIYNMLHGDVVLSATGVMNPHAKVVQQWNQLQFFLLYVQQVSFLKLIVFLSILVLYGLCVSFHLSLYAFKLIPFCDRCYFIDEVTAYMFTAYISGEGD